MFRITCSHPQSEKKQKFGNMISKEQAESYCKVLAVRGYFNFKITEYVPEPEKRGTNKSRAIKAYFGGQ